MLNRIALPAGEGPGGTRPLARGLIESETLKPRKKPILRPVLERVVPNQPQHLLRLACRATRADIGGLALLSATGQVLEHLSFGMSAEAAAQVWRSPWLSRLVAFLLSPTGGDRAPAEGTGPLDLGLTPPALPAGLDELREAVPATVPLLPRLGPFLGVALPGHGRSWGVLYLARPVGSPVFGKEDEEALQTLTCLMKQGNLQEEGHLAARLRLLTQVAQAAAGSQDLAQLCRAALDELERHLPSNICALWLTEPPKAPPDAPAFVLAAVSDTRACGSDPVGLVPGLRQGAEQTGFALSLSDGQALYADLGRREEWHGPQDERFAAAGATASFTAPLRAGEQTVGVFQSVCFRPSGFTNEQIQLFYLVADLLGPALSNCQLFNRLRGAYEDLQLTQQRLIQAEKMRALGELAGGMAHEFNNSLCGTLGLIELALLGRSLDPVSRDYLESARTCAWDAAQTVQRVQDFARQRGRAGALEPLDLSELVRQTVEVTRLKWEKRARAAGTPLAVEVETTGPAWVGGNASELRQILTNLIFNAVDAMPEGGTVTVRVRCTLTHVYLSVADTGVGISEAVRQRLFEPFFTTKGERGNGLGLSVVYSMVRRHGGEITVDSEVGCGAQFTIQLPAAQAPAVPLETQMLAPTPLPAPRGLRVLVIEDEEAIRGFLTAVLKHQGYECRTAENGRKGLELLAATGFDLVLTDLTMPEMDGKQVARAVAQCAPGTPVVMLTGLAGQIEDEGLPEGVACVLSKPVTAETLAAAVRRLCRR